MHSQGDIEHYLGDEIQSLGEQYAEEQNRSEFATILRNEKLPRIRFLGFIAAMYPIVVGFNRGLIRSIAKVNHVRECSFVKALAEQLQEEQTHNQLWREMLSAYGIDHESLYRSLEQYTARFSNEDLDRMTEDVVASLMDNVENVSPGVFPDPAFPEPVLALYHRLWMTASYDQFCFWEHYASQFGIEVIIYDVVSTSIYPGVLGNSKLDAGPATIAWWKEHAKQGNINSGRHSVEEKHLKLAKIALNMSEAAHTIRSRVRRAAEVTMCLLASSMSYHNLGRDSFDIEKYLDMSK